MRKNALKKFTFHADFFKTKNTLGVTIYIQKQKYLYKHIEKALFFTFFQTKFEILTFKPSKKLVILKKCKQISAHPGNNLGSYISNKAAVVE